MFSPRYRVLIDGKCFSEDRCICLGSQLIIIVNALKDLFPAHLWYGADVQAVGINAMKNNVNGFQINPIGTDFDFIQYCSGISQFIWGVFLCVDNSFLYQNMTHIEVGAEDEQFRSIDCKGILLEIRTFDTTFFEIYSDNEETIKAIAKKFPLSEIDRKVDLA